MVSNSAHLELAETRGPLFLSYNNSLMKFSSVSHEISECVCQEPAYSVCTRLEDFNIALIFYQCFLCTVYKDIPHEH